MGCGNPKCVTQYKKRVIITMCHNSAIDELLEPARQGLQTLKLLIRELKYSEINFKHLTYTHILTNSSLIDCIESFLILLISASDKTFEHYDLNFTPISPYMSINQDKLAPELSIIIEAWTKLLQAIHESEQKIQAIDEALKKIVEDLPNIQSKVKNICNTSGMTADEAVKILKTTLYNINIIKETPVLIKKNLDHISELNESCCKIYKIFDQNKLNEILKLGSRIKDSEVHDPKLIVIKFWPDINRIDLALDTNKKTRLN